MSARLCQHIAYRRLPHKTICSDRPSKLHQLVQSASVIVLEESTFHDENIQSVPEFLENLGLKSNQIINMLQICTYINEYMIHMSASYCHSRFHCRFLAPLAPLLLVKSFSILAVKTIW